MSKWKDRAKGWGKKVQSTVDRGIDKYNETLDKIKEPEVQVGITEQTMMYIAGALILIWLLFKRK